MRAPAVVEANKTDPPVIWERFRVPARVRPPPVRKSVPVEPMLTTRLVLRSMFPLAVNAEIVSADESNVMPPLAANESLIMALPDTANVAAGLVELMPSLPELSIVKTSVPAPPNTVELAAILKKSDF